MIRILPFILVVILILGGLGYFRFFAAKQSLTTSQTNTEASSTPVEVPKTLPGATLEDRVNALEDSVKNIVSKVNTQGSSQTDVSLDSRLKIVEAGVTELKARVTSLENSASPAPSSSSSKSTIYIPLGSGGQVTDQGWSSLNTFQISLDPSQYPR